jgi:hypothetical protein
VAQTSRRYSFGPVAEGMSVLGLRPGQLIVLAAGLVACVMLLYVGGAGAGAALAVAVLIATLAIAFAPLNGRTAEQWAPVIARWGRRGGSSRYRSSAPSAGVADLSGDRGAKPMATLPPELGGLDLLSVPVRNAEIGVLRDRRRHTYVGVVSTKVRSFGLLDGDEQEVRLGRWSDVLASFASEGSAVRRVQWVERTVPSDGDELAAYLQAERDGSVPLTDSLVASYIELIEGAGDVTREHEILIALQIDARKGWRAVKRHGGADAGACEVLKGELQSLAERLTLAEVEVEGALRPRQLAAAIRHAFDPYGRRGRERLAKLEAEREGVDPATMGPTAAQAEWARYRSDSAIHTTYWVAGWPRTSVGPAFLQPLLMQADVLRSVSVVMEPVAPAVAIRRAEHGSTKEEADIAAREQRGFRTTSRLRQRLHSAQRREDELAAGHAEVRFAGFVTASAPDERLLERSCADVEHAARRARLELEPLYGQQDVGFTFTLPICRGLR